MDAKIQKLGCKSWTEFRAAVHTLCMEDPQTMVNKLFKSMPLRMKLVLQKKDEKTGY
jgi:hypothetical protein